MSDYINFKEISRSIRFIDLLDWLNVPYLDKNGQVKGEIEDFKFIINKDKNLFFSPDNLSYKGSVINFFSILTNANLRDAAVALKNQFLSVSSPPKRDIPVLDLFYTDLLSDKFKISNDFSSAYEVGLVKQKSIMSGRIAFKCYDDLDNHIGYVGWNPKLDNWYFPKNFKRPLWNYNRLKDKSRVILIANPFDALYLISLGFVCVSLLGESMTDQQEALIVKNCKQVCVLHNKPDNIALRLYPKVFVKAPPLHKPILEHSAEEIVAL